MQRKMVCFFVCLFVCFGCWQQSGGCVDRLLSKGRLPSTDTAGKSFHKQRAGAKCRNSAVSPDLLLETGHRWSDRRLLDYYNHSYSSAPVSLFRFPWGQISDPWRCLSRLQSDRRVVHLFRLVGVPVSGRALTRCGSECNLGAWAGTKGSWLCSVTKLLLFCAVWLLLILDFLTYLIKIGLLFG